MTYRMPKRFFEDSGTVNPEEAYYVPLENVTNRKKQDIKTMIDRGRFFSIFAPRQSGKTTFFEETTAPIDETDVEKAIRLLTSETNDHFDNLFEKAKLYKETFVQIVFDHEEYVPYNDEQSWLEQYGLIKNSGGHAVVSNNIYKEFLTKTFFSEAKVKDINSYIHSPPLYPRADIFSGGGKPVSILFRKA